MLKPSTLRTIDKPGSICNNCFSMMLPERIVGTILKMMPNLMIAATKVKNSLLSGFFPDKEIGNTATNEVNMANMGLIDAIIVIRLSLLPCLG